MTIHAIDTAVQPIINLAGEPIFPVLTTNSYEKFFTFFNVSPTLRFTDAQLQARLEPYSVVQG